MVCNRSYGGVAGYEQDIRDARAGGIIGFALNCGGWNGANYQGDAAQIFQAAQNVAPDGSFSLFFSADMTGLSYPEVVLMMTQYAAHPNYLRVPKALSALETENRPVLTTWGGEGGDWDGPTTASVKNRWQSLVLTPLRAVGIDVYFIPFFFTTSPAGAYVAGSPAAFAAQATGLFAGLADGVTYGDSISVPCPAQDAQNQAAAAAYQAQGLLTMGFVSPGYWGSTQSGAGRPYVEHQGGEGLAARWMSLIGVEKPDWAECFTWNDWSESSYFSPMDDINKYWPWTPNNALGFYKTHSGFARLNRYFAEWFTQGAPPVLTTDTLCWFRRPQLASASCPGDALGAVASRATADGGPVPDTLFVSTLLTAPAELRYVNWQGGGTAVPVGAGLVHSRLPVLTGSTFMSIWRDGEQVLSAWVSSPDYSPALYNFNVESGFAEV